jgi:hypothetical protein
LLKIQEWPNIISQTPEKPAYRKADSSTTQGRVSSRSLRFSGARRQIDWWTWDRNVNPGIEFLQEPDI